jgi:hypothetical protein
MCAFHNWRDYEQLEGIGPSQSRRARLRVTLVVPRFTFPLVCLFSSMTSFARVNPCPQRWFYATQCHISIHSQSFTAALSLESLPFVIRQYEIASFMMLDSQICCS